MKEIPRIFSTAMVQAVQAGIKNQTRRIDNLKKINADPDLYQFKYFKRNRNKELFSVFRDHKGELTEIKSPYDIDVLIWVKETFCYGVIAAADSLPEENDKLYVSQCKGEDSFLPKEYLISSDIGIEDVIWKPSIFMKKKYARIWLEVTGLDIQRLQDITEDDALAEGAYIENIGIDLKVPHFGFYGRPDLFVSYKEAFQDLWDSINGKKYPFRLNPWIYKVTFKKIERKGI